MDTLFSGHYFLHELQSARTHSYLQALHFVTEYLRKGCGELNEVASDNDVVKDQDDDDDDINSKDVEFVKIGIGETLTVLDRLVNLKHLSKEERKFHVAMKFKLEKIRLLN